MPSRVQQIADVEYLMKYHDWNYEHCEIPYIKENGCITERKILKILSEMPGYLAVGMIQRYIPESFQEVYIQKLCAYSK